MDEIRIISIDGQEYQVPTTQDEQTIRTALVQAGFTNAQNAELIKSTTTRDGKEFELWEFRKKAGTKG